MTAAREIWQIDDLVIDVGRQRVERDGVEIELPPLSFRLLLELTRAAPDVLSFDDLMARVWTDLVVGNDTISQRVKLLREALGDSAQNPRYIAGLRGRGYVLARSAQRLDGLPPEPAQPVIEPTTPSPRHVADVEAAAPPGASAIRTRRQVFVWLGSTALLVLAAIFLVVRGTESTAAADARLVVIPFQSLEADMRSVSYAAGVSEELLGILARIPGLQVIAGRAESTGSSGVAALADLGRQHDATYALSGSVRYADDRLRVVAHLVRVNNGEQVWSETYEHPFADLLKTQKSIAAAVGNRLSLELGESIRALAPVNPRAQENLMQAEYLFKQNSADLIQPAMALLNEAVAIEPDYAAAWERLATGYQFEAQYGLRPVPDAFARSRTAATRSIAANPDYGRAHVRLGSIALRYDRDLAAAARHMSRGLALAPRDELANGQVAILLRSLGRAQDALAYARFADGIGSVSFRGHLVSGYTGLVAGDLEFARFRYSRVIELNPLNPRAHYLMGLLALIEDDAANALASCRQETDPSLRSRGLAAAFHSLGNEVESKVHRDAVIAAHAEGRASAYAVATVLAWRGETDEAFTWLQRAADEPDAEYDPDYIDLLVEPLLEPLRTDPRWIAFLQHAGWAPEQIADIEFNPAPPPDVALD